MTVDLLCMGEPMLEFSRLPAQSDRKILYLEGFGGDTSNAAIAAARQGARVGYITAIGDDLAGNAFLKLWAREGVDTSTVKRDPTAQTGVYFITYSDAGHAFHHYRANSAVARYTQDDVPLEAIRAARVLYVSGVSQGISVNAADGVFHAISIAKSAGVAVAYDTNYRPKLWPPARAAAVMHAAMADVTYALPGLEDAAALTGLTDPERILDFYQRLGPSVVVLKMGEAGAWLATADQRTLIPAHPVNAVDAAGAGDAFCGAFLARILAGDDAEPAARFAVVAAGLACTGFGCVGPLAGMAAVVAAIGGGQERAPIAAGD